MTNAEAIAVMERIARWQATKLETTESIEAMDMAIAALREKAERERRYVVEAYGRYWAVYEMPKRICLACYIYTREAAQSIADIYEGVKQ